MRTFQRGLDRELSRPLEADTMGRLIGIVVVIWLVIGVVAAAQRGYFGDNEDVSCKEFADTALTIVSGPLNYMGVNPKVKCENVDAPEPSE
jgi:hypothetical protein